MHTRNKFWTQTRILESKPRPVAPLSAYVEIKDIEFKFEDVQKYVIDLYVKIEFGMYTEARIGCVDVVANGNEIMARGGGSSAFICIRLDLEDIPCGLMVGIQSYVRVRTRAV